ncbi:class III lanthionine synthetase LanKC [Streptomyces sp. NBC_00233]|uniref:class III lanthionine synthetase LanKC n=1 Tax=Streptomyces sp. NBC_00233 TaxID=2975686 RepID=UPI00224DD513|nr:class III lanthionine synthetase LanKC [Streptomyces sp. NBC_00233]MCX5232488.1 class III lanthionine synthetase LanKC [Streptomyces sp. NBC_00233]
MLEGFGEALADREYYLPLPSVADPGPRFAPSEVPPGLRGVAQGIWTAWGGPRTGLAEQGWKIHVSARLDRAQHVLDTVAGICFSEGVPFKHLSARLFFLFLHHKHAGRAQAGKFCAVFPPDTATARLLLERLRDALDGEEGPYVLTDRRFRDSRTVHYRYGSFVGRSRLRADGTREGLVLDGSGREVVDLRLPAFHLPAGIVDPFVEEEEKPHEGPILIRGYEVIRAVRLSNAGGTYQARDRRTGRTVFIKEARAHNGLVFDGTDAQQRLRHEYGVLRELHAAAPGVGPEPLDHFTEWEHDFLVTEFVAGQPLVGWLSRSSPLARADRTTESVAVYYEVCRRLLAALDASLKRLHATGYRFGDLSLGNVMVTPSGGVRLVDFEAASALSAAPSGIGTPGFTPPPGLLGAGSDPLLQDRYGMSAVAFAFLAPFNEIAEHAPANLALLRRDLADVAPPQDLWQRATAFHLTETRAQDRAREQAGDRAQDQVPEPAQARSRGRVPGRAQDKGGPDRLSSPAELDTDPRGCLTRLSEEVAAGLMETADADRPEWAFPPSPEAFRSNNVCLAYGTAGVVYALHRAGAAVPEEIRERLRRDTLAQRDALPPGLLVGTAGIARALAELGLLDEAVELLRDADDHALVASCSTLAGGRAGVGLVWLALHRMSGESRHLERAAAAGERLLRTPDLPATLGEHDARGLLHGRSGLALFLHRLARDTGEARYLEAGRMLLHQELDRTFPLDDGSLSISDNTRLTRAMPYLATGAAGVAAVLTRYVTTAPDERCAAALPALVAGIRVSCATKEAGLYRGLAGLSWFLTEHAELTGTDAARGDAVRAATGLLKYAVPYRRGVRFLGAGSQRFTADLSSGGAGVLLALHRLLSGPLLTEPHPALPRIPAALRRRRAGTP